MSRTTRELVPFTNGWTLRAIDGPVPADVAAATVPATVPGCVHLDLQAAGLIPDPFMDQNEAQVQWIARADWCYETSFDWDGDLDADTVDLVALGLDTVATIDLNGTTVAQTNNMHRSYRFPVTGLLHRGRNKLSVTFRSALTAAEKASAAIGPRPATVEHPINAIRKMACNFGADWGPELVTAGIWRPLTLETWRRARIAAVRPLVDIAGSAGLLRAHVDVERAGGDEGMLRLEVRIAGRSAQAVVDPGQTSTALDVSVPDASFWWPHGHGDQPLYPVTVTMSDDDGPIDTWDGRVGFRRVTLETTPDAHGTPVTIQVNGQPIFARGVNWIPDDPFPSRVDRHRYQTRLTQARDLNANLVRVWGGGVFESEDFYDICDEMGLLVWQDFLFNCACYAEEEPLRDEILAEARDAVTRLSRHPSLALWNGCNENLWGYEDWDWKEPLGDLTWGAGYYFDLLPSIVAELDPTRPYLPGSPYSMSRDRHPLDPAHGTTHIWDVWNTRDYRGYRNYVPRFCSEFGFQGPPTWATLTRAIHDQPLAPDSPGMLAHQKAVDGLGKLTRGLRAHLPEPTSFEDWHWAMSLNQARAVAFGVQHFRSWMPVCMGTIVWQLNDCWPVTSWAAVDGDGHRKPMWYALRRSYRDRLLTIQPREQGLALAAVNDSPDRWEAVVRMTRRRLDGTVLVTDTLELEVEPRSCATIPLGPDLTQAGEEAGELILAAAGQERAWWHFAEDRDTDLPAPEMDVTLGTVEGGYQLSVTARTFIRDLALLVDRLDPDAVVDEMLVTLLPGDRADFLIRTEISLSEDQLSDPLVLRSANQLCRPRSEQEA